MSPALETFILRSLELERHRSVSISIVKTSICSSWAINATVLCTSFELSHWSFVIFRLFSDVIITVQWKSRAIQLDLETFGFENTIGILPSFELKRPLYLFRSTKHLFRHIFVSYECNDLFYIIGTRPLSLILYVSFIFRCDWPFDNNYAWFRNWMSTVFSTEDIVIIVATN